MSAFVRAENASVISDRTTRVLLWIEEKSDSQSDPFRGIPRRFSVEIPVLDFLLLPIRRTNMPDSVYKVIELVGTSSDSWEKAAANAVEQAAKSLRDLRIAEVVKLDMQLDDQGKVEAYRAKLNVSFKFEGS
ncbi:dodecin family protein [Bradyrhizobium yuanmingense]|uniref:dodecin family protein n=2 Tax=Nitrobacteraceae TaxID=41294 RepID=UPI0023EB5902|nr:dodecin family protein [Bradyrhizobium yuanmingense]